MAAAAAASIEGVIDKAYRATHEPSMWAEVVDGYARLLGSEKAALHAAPVSGATPVIFAGQGIDLTPVIDKVHIYGRQAPFAERAIELGLAPGVFIHDEVIPREEMRKTDYYREYMRPTGCDQGLQALLRVDVVTRRAPVALTVARDRDEPSYGAEELRTARACFPHLRRAVLLTLDVNPAKMLDPAVEQAFDGFGTPCCLMGLDSRLVFANRRAVDLANEGVIALSGGALHCADKRADRLLSAAVASACGGDRRWSFRPGSETVLSMEGRAPVVAVVVPLGEANPILNVGPLRAAVYFLDCAVREAKSDELSRLRSLFGLTPAEAEITAGLVKGFSVAELARRRNVSLHTVRTQVKLILEKTQSPRQASLGRLEALFSLELAG